MRRRGAAPSRRRHRFRSARQALTEASQAHRPVDDRLVAPVENGTVAASDPVLVDPGPDALILGLVQRIFEIRLRLRFS